jgi:hypothetical protein
MNAPWVTIAAIAGLAILYILIPVAADTYRNFIRMQVVRCPEIQRLAEVDLDIGYAVRSALVGSPHARVIGCTRWPERKGCLAKCISENYRSGGAL